MDTRNPADLYALPAWSRRQPARHSGRLAPGRRRFPGRDRCDHPQGPQPGPRPPVHRRGRHPRRRPRRLRHRRGRHRPRHRRPVGVRRGHGRAGRRIARDRPFVHAL